MGRVIRLHGLVPCSRANGPGPRAVIWVQGCTLGCRGCFNPETHPPYGGVNISVDELFNRILEWEPHIEGITISGGEPLQQREALLELLMKVRKCTSLSCILFSGYTRDEIAGMRGLKELFSCIDILVAGRYGAAGKTIHFITDRYSLDDIKDISCCEVIIDSRGEIVISGLDPVYLKDWR